MNELQVTPIQELQKVVCGEVIALPPFLPGTEFNARVKRLPMAVLVKAGKIPNPLLHKIYDLFSDEDFVERLENGSLEKGDETSLKEFNEFVDLVVKEALIEPSVAELQNVGIELTDKQKTEIFNYIQGGVNALSSFRNKQGDNKSFDDGQNVPSSPQSNSKPTTE